MTSSRWLLGAAAGVVAASAALVAAGYMATLAIIRAPAGRALGIRPGDVGLAAEVLRFRPRDGIDPKGWWMPARGVVRRTVILAPGRDATRSFMVSRAHFLVNNGYNAFAIDLRAQGESGGRYTTFGYLEALDVLGAVDAVRGRAAGGPFVALGHSSGAVATLRAAASSSAIAAVIADDAFISPAQALERARAIVARDAHASWARRS